MKNSNKSWQELLEDIALESVSSLAPISQEKLMRARELYFVLNHKGQGSELVEIHKDIIESKYEKDLADNKFLEARCKLGNYKTKEK